MPIQAKPPKTTPSPVNKISEDLIQEAETLTSNPIDESAVKIQELPPPTTEIRAGTPANPKTLPLFTEKIRAYALIRSTDGMWRTLAYTIQGNVITEIRTKEPDLKAMLAAQITDALALDMPLFNDEDAPRD